MHSHRTQLPFKEDIELLPGFCNTNHCNLQAVGYVYSQLTCLQQPLEFIGMHMNSAGIIILTLVLMHFELGTLHWPFKVL